MNCTKCKYFRILQEPIRGFDAGKAKCNKYSLYIDFMSHSRLNRLTCEDRPKTEEEKLSEYVSRFDVLDAFGHGNTYTSEEIQEIVKNLPSEDVISRANAIDLAIQSLSAECDDCISRAEALNELKKKFNEIQMILENLPSVQPKREKEKADENR